MASSATEAKGGPPRRPHLCFRLVGAVRMRQAGAAAGGFVAPRTQIPSLAAGVDSSDGAVGHPAVVGSGGGLIRWRCQGCHHGRGRMEGQFRLITH
uniref:Uncharacterized protein n=1 Tax=Oryza nivara TaxID=4536 RepID=A0A0E0HC66_ORYNI